MTLTAPDLTTNIASITLKNPLICGAGEHVMSRQGVRAALAAGAGAVVLKSTNESAAAKEQLLCTDYTLLDASWRPLPWDHHPPAEASLFCRSGLAQQTFAEWLDLAVRMDREAAHHDAYVIASLIPADLDTTIEMARHIEQAGVRILEVNIGAPHGEEAASGAITIAWHTDHVEHITRTLRQAVNLPLWIKLTGQSGAGDQLAVAAQKGGADAVTLMGRFLGVVPDVETQAPLLGTRGAIGGFWALPLTCHWLTKARALAKKPGCPDLPLIATNGARSGLDIARFLLAGASAVQMTTAIFTGGYDVISRCLEDFSQYLARKNMNARDLIGVAADRLSRYDAQERRPDHWKKFLPPT